MAAGGAETSGAPLEPPAGQATEEETVAEEPDAPPAGELATRTGSDEGRPEKTGVDLARLADSLDGGKEEPAPTQGAAQVGPAPKAAQGASPPLPSSTGAPVVHQVPLAAVPIEIGMKSLAGINRFEIRLDPAELGRIEVTLDIGEGGEVKAHLVVDRVETLALLQRDAKTLERAFEQAGLKPSEGGVDLSLRDPSGEGRFQQNRDDERENPRAAASRGDGRDAAQRDPAPAAQRQVQWRASSGIDVRI
jgi:flagellar hook-length control protein FliK